jgi:hypothetical protein
MLATVSPPVGDEIQFDLWHKNYVDQCCSCFIDNVFYWALLAFVQSVQVSRVENEMENSDIMTRIAIDSRRILRHQSTCSFFLAGG